MLQLGYSWDTLLVIERSILSTSTRPARNGIFSPSSLCTASFGISPRSCFPPGSLHAAVILSASNLPIWAKVSPSGLDLMFSARTATTRSICPSPVSTTIVLPVSTSWTRSASFDFASMKCLLALAFPPVMTSSACFPIATWTSLVMESTRSSNAVNGTSRSVGHEDCGGCAMARRRWKALPYCSVTSWISACICITSRTPSERSRITLHGVLATAVPTWIHSDHRAALQSHVPSGTSTTSRPSAGDVPGSCAYSRQPLIRQNALLALAPAEKRSSRGLRNMMSAQVSQTWCRLLRSMRLQRRKSGWVHIISPMMS
mmetsp:Transcript_71323/g.209366  ORF Transcript_71323/g.209366 Transcript_71323/m.209366 type:complete len:316 (+) Transcript_71323:389-1336(+)